MLLILDRDGEQTNFEKSTGMMSTRVEQHRQKFMKMTKTRQDQRSYDDKNTKNPEESKSASFEEPNGNKKLVKLYTNTNTYIKFKFRLNLRQRFALKNISS